MSAGRPQVVQVITDNDRRGGQVFATDLHPALERRGLDVRTLALAPGANGSGLGHPVLGPTRRHPRTLRALRRAISEADAVVGHGSTTLPMCALGGVGLGTPFIYRQISDQLFWANTRGRRMRTRAALAAADGVVALWDGAADVLESNFGVPFDRISVIPNGVPADRCPPPTAEQRMAAKQRFGLDPGRPVLLSIGALVPEKGVDVLVRAMAEPRLEGWQLLIVGAGPERSRLERDAAAVSDRTISIHGPLALGPEAMAAADVIGLTSRGGDSMPAVLIEAGMMGVPAVATPVEGIVDVVLDGRTGRLVPLDDPGAAAVAVSELGGARPDFGKAARDHCLREFEINAVAEKWHEAIEAVLRTPGRVSGPIPPVDRGL